MFCKDYRVTGALVDFLVFRWRCLHVFSLKSEDFFFFLRRHFLSCAVLHSDVCMHAFRTVIAGNSFFISLSHSSSAFNLRSQLFRQFLKMSVANIAHRSGLAALGHRVRQYCSPFWPRCARPPLMETLLSVRASLRSAFGKSCSMEFCDLDASVAMEPLFFFQNRRCRGQTKL